MKNSREKTLAGDLITGLVVIVSVSTFLVVAIHIWLYYQETSRDLSTKSEEYIRFLRDSLGQPIWNCDYDNVEKIAESFLKNEIVSAIRITTERNEPIFESESLRKTGPDHQLTTAPMTWKGISIGNLDLWLNPEPRQRALFDLFWGSLTILVISLAAITGVTRFFVTRFFRRPLLDLMGRMEECAKGRFSFPTETFRHKETIDIIEKFSEMAKRIELREKSLENLNADLEAEIEERKRIAVSLSESEKHWHDIIHFASVGIYQVAVDGRILLVNPKFADIFGYDTPEKLVAEVKSFGDLYADPENRMRLIQKNRDKGDVSQAEARFKHKDGRDIWCHLSCRLTERNGESVVEGFILDMTERKQAEEALLHSERRLAQIINFLPDPTFVVDAQSRVIAWNHAIEDLTGVKAEKMLGKGDFEYAIPLYGKRRPVLIDLVRTWDEETVAKYAYVQKEGNILVSETPNPPFKPNGACFWNRACPLFDDSGQLAGAIETIRDISKIKRIEGSLRESEYRFRTFFHSSPNGVAIIGFNGELMNVNKTLLLKTAFTREQMIGSNFKHFIPIEHHRRLDESLEFFGKGIIPDMRFEIEYLTKDGGRKPANLHAWLMTDRENQAIGVAVFFQDISRIKHLASEKADLEKQLQQSQKLEAIGTLAGGIAHDFNNILAGILGYSELIQLKFAEDSPVLSDYLDRILKSGNRARDIIRQILQYSREENALSHPLEMGPIVKETMKLLQATLPSTVRIHECINVEMEMVSADATRIHQVIMNLCTNAYHALRKNGGDLIIGLQKVELNEIRYAHGSNIPPGPYLKLTVSDNGPGIPPDIIERIFDPYFTTKKVNEGTGLGLSVTLGIVKNLKGLIEVASTPGAGAAFTVFLPVAKDNLSSGKTRVDDVPRGHREHILIVDDETYFLEAVQEHLSLLGYRVSTECGGIHALTKFQKCPTDFDLILTDQTMPDMTGIQLSGHIRELNPTIPIILCTGFSDQVTQQTAGHFGISRFLMKPVSRVTLAQVISELLHTEN